MIIEEFKEVTGYDIRSLIELGVNFITQKYPIYRNSLVNGLDSSKYMRSIEDWFSEYDRFQSALTLYSSSLDNSEYWDMLEKVDEIWSFMNVSKKLGKFLRVVDLRTGVTQDRILREGQDLENLGFETGNEWEDLAIDNSIIEEDYTPGGGNTVRTPMRFSFNSQNIESCVVAPVGQEIYGRDIKREFGLRNSDIQVLDNKATLIQTCGILVGLVKGAIPDNRSMGIGNQDFVGSVVGFSYPAILRQVSDSFRTDDSFSSIGVSSIQKDGNGVSIEFSIETRMGETINVQRKL